MRQAVYRVDGRHCQLV